MWLCLNNAFFSIVAPNGDAASEDLVVRARRKGDIERVFDVPGVASPGRDYAFRAQLPRDVVAAVLMWQVLGIDYGNFKSSVKDDALHRAYNRVWGVMGALQVGGPYGNGPKQGRQRALPMGTNYGPRGAAARHDRELDEWRNPPEPTYPVRF